MRLAISRLRNASDSTDTSTYRSWAARAPRRRRRVRAERTYVARQRRYCDFLMCLRRSSLRRTA